MASSIGIDYSQDSPLFNKRVNDFDTDLSKLVDYFKTISKSMNQFCYDMKKASISCDLFQNELRTGLHGIKSHNKIVQMMETVAEIFAEISSSQDILSNSLMHSFITPFEDFCSNEVARVNQLQNLYKKEKTVMEEMMLRYLHCDTTTNHHLHRTSTHPSSSSSSSSNATTTNNNMNTNTVIGSFSRNITNQLQLQQTGPDCRAYDVVQSRKRFELIRYDMMSSMYELDQKKSFDVAETCIASLISLRSHYHYCSEKLHSCDKYINTLNKQQQDERIAYDVTKSEIATKRVQLSDTLQISIDRVTNQIPTFILEEYISTDRLENVISNISTHGLSVDDVERATNVASNALSKFTAFGVTFFGGGGGGNVTAVNKDKPTVPTHSSSSNSNSSSSAVSSVNASRNQSPIKLKNNAMYNHNHNNNNNSINSTPFDSSSSSISALQSASSSSSSSSAKDRKVPIQENIIDRDASNNDNNNNNDINNNHSDSHKNLIITEQPHSATTAVTASNNNPSVLQSVPQSLAEVEARVQALEWPQQLDTFFSHNQMDAYAGVVKQGYVWEKVQGKSMLQPSVWNREWLVLDSTKLYFIKSIITSGTSGSGSGSNNTNTSSSGNSSSCSSGSSTEVQVICDLLLASVRESKPPTIMTNHHYNNSGVIGGSGNNSSSASSGLLDAKTYLYTFEVAYANFKTYVFQAEGPREYTSWVTSIRGCIEKRLTLGSAASPYLQVAGNSLLASQAAATTVSGNRNKNTSSSSSSSGNGLQQVVNTNNNHTNNSDYVIISTSGGNTDGTLQISSSSSDPSLITTTATNTNNTTMTSSSLLTTNTITSLSQLQQQQQQRRGQMPQLIHSLLTLNPYCAECHKPHPEWISLNLGTFICIDCSGVHRSLGVHISKVRSLTLDEFEPEECYFLGETGNTLNHAVWQCYSLPLSSSSSSQQGQIQAITTTMTGGESSSSSSSSSGNNSNSNSSSTSIAAKAVTNDEDLSSLPVIPISTDNYTIREKFIRAKYESKRFLAPLSTIFPLSINYDDDDDDDNDGIPREEIKEADVLLNHLFLACRTNNVSMAMTCIAHGVDINTCRPFPVVAVTTATNTSNTDNVDDDDDDAKANNNHSSIVSAAETTATATTATAAASTKKKGVNDVHVINSIISSSSSGDNDNNNNSTSTTNTNQTMLMTTITTTSSSSLSSSSPSCILKSPLHVAAENGSISCVVLLLLHGAESTFTIEATHNSNHNNNNVNDDDSLPHHDDNDYDHHHHQYERLRPSELAWRNGHADLALYIKNKSESKLNYTTTTHNNSNNNNNSNSNNNTSSSSSSSSMSASNSINNNNTNNINNPSKSRQQSQRQPQQPIAVEIDFDYTV